MRIYQEMSLDNFEFWGQAKRIAETLTHDELAIIENSLIDWCACNDESGIDATELNDLFAYDFDTVADWLGFENWEELEAVKNGELYDVEDFINWLYLNPEDAKEFLDTFNITIDDLDLDTLYNNHAITITHIKNWFKNQASNDLKNYYFEDRTEF